jgi:hypothetical protein
VSGPYMLSSYLNSWGIALMTHRKTDDNHVKVLQLNAPISQVRTRVLQAQYLRTELSKGNQYLSTVLVNYPGEDPPD